MMHGPGDDGELDEVKVTAKVSSFAPAVTSSPKMPPEENLPEIVVQARRVPWWVWGAVGALAVLAFMPNKRSSRR